MKDRLNVTVNLAILGTLALLLFRPDGVIGRHFAEWRDRVATRDRIATVWDDLAQIEGATDSARSAAAHLVEFIDYECPFCRTIAPYVEAAADSVGVKVVVRHFPIETLHPQAEDAARGVICAEEQGMFKAMHDWLLTTEEWQGTARWSVIATEVGIDDVSGFHACMTSNRTRRKLMEDRRLAEFLGISGTPAFVTADGVFTGAEGARAAFRTFSR